MLLLFLVFLTSVLYILKLQFPVRIQMNIYNIRIQTIKYLTLAERDWHSQYVWFFGYNMLEFVSELYSLEGVIALTTSLQVLFFHVYLLFYVVIYILLDQVMIARFIIDTHITCYSNQWATTTPSFICYVISWNVSVRLIKSFQLLMKL